MEQEYFLCGENFPILIILSALWSVLQVLMVYSLIAVELGRKVT